MDISNSDHWMGHKKGKYKGKTKLYCSNCGKFGHPYKNCKDPITSFGVINILLTTDDQTVIDNLKKQMSINVDIEGTHKTHSVSILGNGINFNGPNDIKTFCTYKDNIRFLMVRRRHTLGFLEFIRGRYNVENVDGIVFLFSQMTEDEIKQISTSTLDELWAETWSSDKNKLNFLHEFEESQKKFNMLKSGVEGSLNLDFYVTDVRSTYNSAEWGFPKGRRDFFETDLMCGIREFQEESGIEDGDYVILDKIKPIEENLIGTNGINYRHIYFPAISSTNKRLTIINTDKVQSADKVQSNEIGDIGWFTYEEAMRLIRPYHTDRQKLLTELYMYIINSIALK